MPIADTLIDGGLAQAVAGLGAYGLWNDTWYGDLSFYRSSIAAVSQPLPQTGTINGLAPYWRLAWQRQFGPSYLEVGTFGMVARFNGGRLGTGAPALADRYTDVAVDSQYERPVGADLLSVHAVVIHEQRNLASSFAAGSAAYSKGSLLTERVNGIWHFRGRYAAGVGYFTTHGSADPVLYAPGSFSGSASGAPDSRGWITQLTYLPWENTQFALQYTAYNQFNGGTSNYDSTGRSASGNNTTYLLAWLVW